ncbi:MFS transporter [Ornithinimicrobium sp. W1679]|uniref:MFS transporter n=1 Tax=Ornithinimicrobium sp. W1679 TaxID=3418770 RepID=UPI003CF00673
MTTGPSPALPRPWRALVVWGVALTAYVIAVTGRTSLGVAGPQAMDRFSMGAGTLATFSVVQLSVYAAAQIPAGVILDRIGSRIMIASGALLMGTGQLLLAVSDSLPLALTARVLIGLGDAATLVSVLRLLPFWFRPRIVPMITQLSGIIGQLGQIISAVPFLALLLAVGWVPAFSSLAAAGLVVALLVLSLVRDLPPDGPARPVAGRHGSVLSGLRLVAREPGTWLGFFTHFVTLFPGNMLLLLWGVPFFTEGHGISVPHAGALLTITAVCTILIGPVLGDLVGRYPARRTRLVVLTVLATVVVWVAILLPSTPRPFWQLTGLAVVSAAGLAACTIGFDFARTSVPSTHLGRATGLVNMGGYLASVLAILLVGLVLDLSQPSGEYTLADFRLAFALGLTPLFVVGVGGLALARRAVLRAEVVPG